MQPDGVPDAAGPPPVPTDRNTPYCELFSAAATGPDNPKMPFSQHIMSTPMNTVGSVARRQPCNKSHA
jgi:hypothetical protein